MRLENKHKQKVVSLEALENAAEAWARICLYHAQHKQLAGNKYKKTYEYNTK